ncbi:MAG: PorT family protein [Prevotella sp.]|nr:PorT family protein [Prevotella sp.]
MFYVKSKRLSLISLLLIGVLCGYAQQRKVQYKPYIDLRPLHFGIVVGTHLQDIEFENVGLQTLVDEEGNVSEHLIVTDADKWNPGFSVGVLAELRLHDNFALRFSPSMHFGAKHLTFLDLMNLDEEGRPQKVTQDLKNTYVGLPLNIKFSAPRWNNYRPFISAGISGMINLTGGGEDYISLKRFSSMLEVGIGCDFYLPFFKLIPELKFCYGLGNTLDTNHINELRDTNHRAYAGSVSSAQSKMIMLSFYFE